MNLLDKIINNKKQELLIQKRNKPLIQIRKKCDLFLKNKKNTRSLIDAIANANPIGLIAEIKLASPSAGKLTKMNHTDIAGLYAASKADAISVLTDKIYFNGNISYLKAVKKICPQPIFRKDFIIDDYQIYETALAGGDAFLLIASVLSLKEIKKFIALGKKLRLECLVETRNKEDIEKAVEANAEIIGINNRDLKSMNIDFNTTEKLINFIPKNKIVISESGIHDYRHSKKLIKLGVNGILAGTSIIKSKNLINKIAELKGQK